MKRIVCSVVAFLAVALTLTARAEIANVAGQATAYANRTLYSTWNIQRLIDGDRQGSLHLDTAIDPGAAYDLDLGKDYAVQEILIYPRQDDCCPERFRQLHVSVRTDSNGSPGAEVWGMDLFTDGTNPGSS